MCILCDTAGDVEHARRAHVLELLALIEHPDALPAEAALRLGREVMALVASEPSSLRCEVVTPGEHTDDNR